MTRPKDGLPYNEEEEREMSVTKDFLADPENYSDNTKEGQSHPDPAIRDLLKDHIIRDQMICADGFKMSVQYSRFHYCNGRERFMGGEMESRDDPAPEPRTVEIGFPSHREPELLGEYAEEPKRMTKTVYGWVPVATVDAVIAKHGGLRK